jgi:hypothetical protein
MICLWLQPRVHGKRPRVAHNRADRLAAGAGRWPDTLLCEGSIRIGWVDAADLRPQRLPAAFIRQALGLDLRPDRTNFVFQRLRDAMPQDFSIVQLMLDASWVVQAVVVC